MQRACSVEKTKHLNTDSSSSVIIDFRSRPQLNFVICQPVFAILEWLPHWSILKTKFLCLKMSVILLEIMKLKQLFSTLRLCLLCHAVVRVRSSCPGRCGTTYLLEGQCVYCIHSCRSSPEGQIECGRRCRVEFDRTKQTSRCDVDQRDIDWYGAPRGNRRPTR